MKLSAVTLETVVPFEGPSRGDTPALAREQTPSETRSHVVSTQRVAAWRWYHCVSSVALMTLLCKAHKSTEKVCAVRNGCNKMCERKLLTCMLYAQLHAPGNDDVLGQLVLIPRIIACCCTTHHPM